MDPQAIIEIFRRNITDHYFDLKGRVSREEFWYFIVANIVVGVAAALVAGILHIFLLSSLVYLALLPPTAGLAARRLQDTGKDGSLVWVAIVPMAVMGLIDLLTSLGGLLGALGFLVFFFAIGWLIDLAALAGAIWIAYLCAQPGATGENQYGPEPPKFTPAAPAAT